MSNYTPIGTNNRAEGPHRPWMIRHWFSFLLIGVLAAVVILRWPMVKGWLYGMADAAPADGIPWRTDFDAALAEAKKTGKPVLLDFSATWCPPCRTMKHEVWPDPEVSRLASELFIPVLVDVDQNQATTARYGITGIPTILIVHADGKVLHRTGFESAASMQEFLRIAGKPASL